MHTARTFLDAACEQALRDPDTARHMALQAWVLSADPNTRQAAISLAIVLGWVGR